VTAFEPLLGLLASVPDPRRGQGQLYKLPHVLLFSILAIVTGCNSYRGIVTFIDVHRHKLNATFGLKWRRAPAYTAIRYILKRLDPAEVEVMFRRHAALLQASRAIPGTGTIALDGNLLRWSAARLASEARLGRVTINRAEGVDGVTTLTAANVQAVWRTLVAAGVEFIPSNGGGPGVSLLSPPAKQQDQS